MPTVIDPSIAMLENQKVRVAQKERCRKTYVGRDKEKRKEKMGYPGRGLQ